MPKGVYSIEKRKGLFHKGQIGFWKGKKKAGKRKLGWKLSEETKRKMSKYRKGKHHSEETRKKIGLIHKGISNGLLGEKHWNWKGGLPRCKECGKELASYIATYCLSCAKKGEKNVNWKGGIAPINNQIRGSLEYKLWEDSVLSRDGYCCVKCSENRVRNLMAHHIQNFAQIIELRTSIENGITFCRNCHKEFHHIYGKKNNTREQLYNFIAY